MAKSYLDKTAFEYYHSKVKTVIQNYVDGLDLQDGVTPDIQIGEVETLEPGSSVVITITGTPEQPIFNIGIPRGEDGSLTNSSIENIDAVVRSIEASQNAINQQLSALGTVDSNLIKRIDNLESKVDTSLDNGAVKVDNSGIILNNNATFIVKGDNDADVVVIDENGGKFNNITADKMTAAYHSIEKTSVDDDLEVSGFFFVGGM